MSFKRTVLSIDGGGIRGIIPAVILAEIENQTGKPICKLFDLIAGTSTGGILTLGLTKPDPNNRDKPRYKATDLVDMYMKRGKDIFKEEFVGKALGGLDDILRPKYPSQGREKVLKEYFGDTLLKDALTSIFLTSYDIEKRIQVFFISNSDFQRETGDSFRKLCEGYKMREAAMATSAAPVYFQPYKLANNNKDKQASEPYYALVDGGLFANNPTSLAVIEALIYNQRDPANPSQEPLKLEEILVVSLGTGSLMRKYAYDKAANWGLIKWVEPLINITMDGGSETAGYQLYQLLRSTPQQYYRFQKDLTEATGAKDDMDTTDEENLKNLKKVGEDIVKSPMFPRLCKVLMSIKS